LNLLLKVENLKKYFHNPAGMLHAVDDISFLLNKNETIGIVGESGCGKSTLGRTITDLIPKTSGKIYFDGKDTDFFTKKQKLNIRKEMQMVFQDPYASLNPRMTIYQTIEEPIRLHKLAKGKDIENRVFDIMKTVGLAADLIASYPHELDGGRRQRVSIGRALALNPQLLVCDEPVSALDVSIQAQILNLLKDLKEENGLAMIFITHDISVVKHISDKIMIMYLGEMVEYASKKEIFNNPRHPYTKALFKVIPIPKLSYRNQDLEIIKGEIKSPVNPGIGCRFYSRCPYAQEICKESQGIEKVSETHFVRCCRYESI